MKCTRWDDITDDDIVLDAQLYPTRTEWKRGNSKAYQHVHLRRRHLIPACTEHMGDPVEDFRFNYQVYAYEFEDGAAYIGLTCSPKARHWWHSKQGPIYERKGTPHTLRILAENLSVADAKQLEISKIASYRETGWTLLNTRAGGETGGAVKAEFPSYESVLEYARAHNLKRKADLPLSAQSSCWRRGWTERVARDMGWHEHSGHTPLWTREACAAQARQYTTSTAWFKGHQASYKAAHKYGWLKSIQQELGYKLHANRGKVKKWTREACASDAQRFTSRSRWQYGGTSGYCMARRQGWLPAIADETYGNKTTSEVGSNTVVYAVTGASGAGKSTLCAQVARDRAVYRIEQDKVTARKFQRALVAASQQPLPILFDLTSLVSTTVRRNPKFSFKLYCVVETVDTINQRLAERGGKMTLSGTLKRIKRINSLARQFNAVTGTADEIRAALLAAIA